MVVGAGRVGDKCVAVHLDDEGVGDAVREAMEGCSLVESTLSSSSEDLGRRLQLSSPTQQLHDLGEMGKRHFVDQGHAVSEVVDLPECFLPTFVSTVFIDGCANPVEGRGNTSDHVSLDTTTVTFELINHDLGHKKLQPALLDEPSTFRDELLAF